MKTRILNSVLLVLIVPFQSASASLVAYEGFDYQVGSQLLTQNGGSGFSSDWEAGGFNASIHNNYQIASGSLGFQGLLTSGNRVVSSSQNAISGIVRDLTLPGSSGTTQYISFLVRPEGTPGDGAFNGFFGLNFERSATELFVGKPGGGALGEYVLENRGGASQFPSGASVVDEETAFVVLRVDYLAGADNVTMYLDPTPGAPEPTTGTVKSDIDLINTNGLALYSTGAFSFDELRVGDTFESVTPVVVPEPRTVTILLVALTSMLLRMRRTARKISLSRNP